MRRLKRYNGVSWDELSTKVCKDGVFYGTEPYLMENGDKILLENETQILALELTSEMNWKYYDGLNWV